MGKPPFPAAETLIAPPSWRCIDFISDLHLQDDLTVTTQALRRHLQDTPADAVFILGDLFEAWVGDDMRSQAYEAQCVAMLRAAGERLDLLIMVGNRDFLLAQDMLTACAALPLQDPTVLQAWGQRFLLTHGDALCLSDQAYLRFRAQVRQADWQDQFLAAPLQARLDQARAMRQASQAHQQGSAQMSAMISDLDEAAAGNWMRAANTPVLIHGHTHQPESRAYGIEGGFRHVLSDWDLDHARPRAEVLRLSAQGAQRLPVHA